MRPFSGIHLRSCVLRRREHRHGRVVGMHDPRLPDRAPSGPPAARPVCPPPSSRHTSCCGRRAPPAARRCFPAGTAAGDRPACSDDVGQQARPGQALVDRLRGLLRRGDVRVVAIGVALRARVLVANVLQDLEAGRKIFQLLADLFADPAAFAAAGRTAFLPAAGRARSRSAPGSRAAAGGRACRGSSPARVGERFAGLILNARLVERRLSTVVQRATVAVGRTTRCAGRSSGVGCRRIAAFISAACRSAWAASRPRLPCGWDSMSSSRVRTNICRSRSTTCC